MKVELLCVDALYLEYWPPCSLHTLQGGTKQFKYPLYVWSPSGGWWCNPRQWRRNTVIAFGAIGVISAGVWYISAQLEVCKTMLLVCILHVYECICSLYIASSSSPISSYPLSEMVQVCKGKDHYLNKYA